ncbi:MAG TPA: hypothetical protein VFU64_06540 [Gaiellaceae bacterium]|nr:hypothetical protein [Gaiellaceae bacterium]
MRRILGVTPEEHRALGVELYNGTWALIEREDRTPDEDDEMLHRAHASAYHWLQAPHTAANRARSHWLCSHVYAVLGRPEPALHHGERCLALVEGSPQEMADFDLPAAYEALARAHSAAGRSDEARRFLELAQVEAAKIADAEDREHFESQLASIVT